MKTWYWILITLVLVLLPLGINFLILIPQQFPVIGNGADWLSFWTTYISAMASFAMVFITWRTLQQSKVQQEELKMQWEDEQRARLNFTIDIAQEIYVLKIRNVGKSDAYKIKIKINKGFIDSIAAKSIKEIYANLQNTSFCIEAGKSRFFYISRFQSNTPSTITIGDETFSNKDINEWIGTNKNQEIVITGTYCEKYQINETLKLADIMIDGALRIRDDLTIALESINKGSVSPNNTIPLYTIQKSLDIIAKKISEIQVKEKSE